MSYERQIFVDEVRNSSGNVVVEGTTLTAGHMTHIEDGIVALDIDVARLKENVSDLLYVPIAISSFENNIGTAELGSTVAGVVLSWMFNKTPATVTLDGAGIDPSMTSIPVSGNITKNRTWTLAATDERKATATKSTSITFLNGVYYGVMEDGATINSAAILGLTKKLQGSKGITFTANAGGSQRIVYALPARYGKPNFNVGGFDGGFTKAATIAFTNASGYTESYDIWQSDNTGLGSTTVKVS